MTRVKFFTLLMALLIGAGAYAQSVDEIVAKNIAAMGGADKLKGIKTEYIEGSMEVQGQTVPVKRWVKQNEAMRLEFSVMGTNNVQVINHDSGWTLMPVMMQTSAQDMDAQLVKMMKSQLDLRGELYDYKGKGKKIELQGQEAVNGASAYKLKITSADGTQGIVYLDTQTFLLVKAVNHVNLQGQELDLETLFSDYKKTPDGITYAAVTEQSPGGVKIHIDKIENNQPLAESLFAKP
ncbi:hypothetical protein ACDQ55_05740 [Chitinophaga sp. 30R24]|uniref:hypothetical protein n=1 Tax=Chitinophaga sp. 30R24 TaxID=3248838 RepID=UPI003B8F5930